MQNLFIILAISLVLPLFYALMYKLRSKEEKKRRNETYNRTRISYATSVFFIVAAILFFAAGTGLGVWAIIDGQDVNLIVTTFIVFFVFGALPVFGFIYSKCRYEFYDDEKITTVRLRKNKVYYYKDIGYYNYVEGFIGGLTVYDKNGIKLFSSEGTNVGIDGLVNRLIRQGIPELPKNFFKTVKDVNPVFKRHYIKTLIRGYCRGAFAFVLISFSVAAMIFTLNDYHEFENYKVTGIIESYRVMDDLIDIKLKDDENNYRVFSLTYKKMDISFKYDLAENEEIVILVGYTSNNGNKIISQIEYNGKTYLSAADSEDAVTADYNLGKTMAYVFTAIGSLSAAVWLFLLIYGSVKYRNQPEKN